MAQQDLASLRQLLVATQSSDAALRKGAEDSLSGMERQPAYPQLLVALIEFHCAGTSADDKSLRTLGAIMFKNLVKRAWVAPEDGEGKEGSALSTSDKDAIKGNMVHMMCIVPPEVQRQFSEALSIISQHDFPQVRARVCLCMQSAQLALPVPRSCNFVGLCCNRDSLALMEPDAIQCGLPLFTRDSMRGLQRHRHIENCCCTACKCCHRRGSRCGGALSGARHAGTQACDCGSSCYNAVLPWHAFSVPGAGMLTQ